MNCEITKPRLKNGLKFMVLTRPSGSYPSRPVLPVTITHSVSFTAYGYVKYHTAGTSPVDRPGNTLRNLIFPKP